MNKIPGFLFSRENQQKSRLKLKYKKAGKEATILFA